MNKSIGTIAIDYPESVKDIVTYIMMQLDAHDYLNDEIMNTTTLEKLLCELAFEKFMTGEEIEFEIAEIASLLDKAVATTVVDSLIDDGLLNTIEDEDGKEIVFLTQKGKSVVEEAMSVINANLN